MLLRTCKCCLCYLVLLVLMDVGGTRRKPYSYQYVHREFYQPEPTPFYYGFEHDYPDSTTVETKIGTYQKGTAQNVFEGAKLFLI